MHSQYELLTKRRFLPVFITQFMGAFNDNVFKYALIILITYELSKSPAWQQISTAMISGLFILPFFLFSATAGQVADKFEKSRIIRIIRVFELTLVFIATFGFYYKNIFLLYATMFLFGLHSSFFGPLKYSILPDLLKEKELIAGNALIEAATFIAILTGTILGGAIILTAHGIFSTSLLMLAMSLIGLISSFFIPKTPIGQPDLEIKLNIFEETIKIIKYCTRDRVIFLCILTISWFWVIGTTLVTLFPSYTKNVLNANQSVFTFLFTLFSIGIAVGSLLCNRLLKGNISTRYVPSGALGMSVFIIDLYFASKQLLITPGSALITLSEFFNHAIYWRILFDVFLLSVCGGIYIVPLFAIMQAKATEAHRARVIAGNNIFNALFMVLAAVSVVFLIFLKFTTTQIFFIVGTLNLCVAIYLMRLLPHELIQPFLRWFLKLIYRVEVRGLDNFSKTGNKFIVVANHTSFLDPLLLAAFLPRKLTFAVNAQMAQTWWMRITSKYIPIFPLEPSKPFAIKSLIKLVKSGQNCVIFPEGRITVTGSLMKIYEGPGVIADQTDAKILPVRIDGAQYSIFSKLRNKVHLQFFPKIILTVQPPIKLAIKDELFGKHRRQYIGRKLYDVMSSMMFESSNWHQLLFYSLLEARKIHGGHHIVLEDIKRKPINYNELITHIFIVKQQITKFIQKQDNVGILLPNSIATVVCFFAIQLNQSLPAMLNYGMSRDNLLECCKLANIRFIISSRQFLETANLTHLIPLFQQHQINTHFLEDLRNSISWKNKIAGWLASKFSGLIFEKNHRQKVSLPAVILFTSGSEGFPKGVVLSHENLQANRYQLSARIDFTATDRIFNALPLFHAFGLNAATLLPLISGVKVFLYPSPLHYRIIPEVIYEQDATMLFGTNTFLRGYARNASSYDFYSLRYVLAGAEKLTQDTHDIWVNKFGIRILEGYGTTETSPVLSTNTPMQYKENTVGRLLPGIKFRVEVVAGIKEGGKLWVNGPNVMLGYLSHTSPGKLIPPKDNWYDTGDIVSIDEEAYIRILGRAKRFAKVGGEMVSLNAVEAFISSIWPNYMHAAIAASHKAKGEEIILITNCTEVNKAHIIRYAKEHDISELMLPKRIVQMEEIPLLSTGKIDYPKLMALFTSLDRSFEELEVT